MAELLKSGAKMLSEACPQCSSPLFEVKGEIFCAKCNKSVVKLKPTDKESKLVGSRVMDVVEQTILDKIQEVTTLINDEHEQDKLLNLVNILSGYLTALEKIKKLK